MMLCWECRYKRNPLGDGNETMVVGREIIEPPSPFLRSPGLHGQHRPRFRVEMESVRCRSDLEEHTPFPIRAGADRCGLVLRSGLCVMCSVFCVRVSPRAAFRPSGGGPVGRVLIVQGREIDRLLGGIYE